LSDFVVIGDDKNQSQAVMLSRLDSNKNIVLNDNQQKWLVLSDDKELSENFKTRIESFGNKVILVGVGESYTKIKEDEYIINSLEKQDYEQLFDDLSDDTFTGIISCLGFSDKVLDIPGAQLNICTSTLYLVQSLVRDISHKVGVSSESRYPKLYFITSGAQSKADEGVSRIWQSGLWGMGRTIFNEHPEFNLRMIDLDPLQASKIQGDALFNSLFDISNESQVLIRDNLRYVGRLIRASVLKENEYLSIPEEGYYQVLASELGVLDDLVVNINKLDRVGENEIRIRVKATGLNFRDVLIGMRLYPGVNIELGSDFSGIVEFIGSSVEDYKVGDSVIGVGQGCLSNLVQVNTQQVSYKTHRKINALVYVQPAEY
jgi:hypothetical protein